MTTARDEILARIRAVPRAMQPVERAYRRNGTLTPEERVDLFHERVADYHADVRRVAADDVATAIVGVCADHNARRLVVPSGLPAAWLPSGIEAVEGDGLDARALDAVDGVVTGCTVAVAETGTIVLEGMRVLTLVPDLHICVVREEQIVELVAEAIATLQPLGVNRRPLTLVSGPSATSDIELSRVEGVHGPRRLVTLLTSS